MHGEDERGTTKGRLRVHTCDSHGQECESTITFYKGIQDDTSAATDGHSCEKRPPSLRQEMPDVLVSISHISPSNGSDGKGDDNDDGPRCVENEQVEFCNNPQ